MGRAVSFGAPPELGLSQTGRLVEGDVREQLLSPCGTPNIKSKMPANRDQRKPIALSIQNQFTETYTVYTLGMQYFGGTKLLVTTITCDGIHNKWNRFLATAVQLYSGLHRSEAEGKSTKVGVK